jgi:hypothetical protein
MAAVKHERGVMMGLAPPSQTPSDLGMAGQPFRMGEQGGPEASAGCMRSKAS